MGRGGGGGRGARQTGTNFIFILSYWLINGLYYGLSSSKNTKYAVTITQDNFENWTSYPEIKLLHMGGSMQLSPFKEKHFNIILQPGIVCTVPKVQQ